MSGFVEVVGKRELAVKIHYWAQDILRANSTCGLGKTPEGKSFRFVHKDATPYPGQ